ncbi:hypothetical protein V2J09_006787 [Rumex salicifolius]
MTMDREQIRFIIGILGNVIAISLFLSPVPTSIDIIKKKSTQEYNPNPYLAAVLSCGMWVFYGMPFVHPDSILVITINSAGVTLELVYVRKMTMILIAELVIFVVVIVCTLKFVHGTDTRTIVVGSVSVACNIIMYAAPLTIMRAVIQTKSVKFMPLPLSLCTLCNGTIWVTYALVKFDPWILTPNALGVVSGLVQVFLYAMYYKKDSSHNDEENGHELREIPA